ncbi:MAG: helix-turn-helix transcriptional regulator [Candidatus Omnitrophota bacterium]
MIEHELLLLGLLKESPKHGYEIKKKIKEILSLFAGLEPKSIYYPLNLLEKKGLVIKHTAKQGRRPQRFVYALSKSGQARFDKLLSASFLDFKRPHFSLDLSLYFLSYINSNIARRRLKGRVFILNKLSRDLKQMLRLKYKQGIPLPLKRILEHNLQMVETESKFLLTLIKTV